MWTLALVGLAFALFLARFALPAGTPRIRPAGKQSAARSIAVLEKVRIGGVDQWVLQRSQDVGQPILLLLHGGPGTSQLTTNRRNTRALEKHFVVVNWDQRGAGKSYAAIRETGRMNLEQFVSDTRELTLHLLGKFGKSRLVLAGHSWGSVVGALAVARYPDLYACYVGIGQVANVKEGEAVSYRWTLEQARARKDRRAIRALERIGPPPYQGDWQAKILTQRRLLARFGGEVHGSDLGAVGIVLGGLLLSREYGLRDRLDYFRGILGSMRLLWPELLEVDLFERVPELKVPVFLAEGRFDREAPSEIAARWLDALEAPEKALFWFEKSGHLPNFEQREAFDRLMVDEVLPVAARRDVPPGKGLP